MPFDQSLPDGDRGTPKNCRCFVLFGNAIYDETGLCRHCGGINSPLGLSAPDLKQLIVHCAFEGHISAADAQDLIAFYGLRGT